MVDKNEHNQVNCPKPKEDEPVKCQNEVDCKSSTFSQLNVSYEEIKQMENYKSCEILENINIPPDEWKELALKQLKFRDFLLESYKNNQTLMVHRGIALEVDIKGLQVKIEELNCQIKRLRKQKLSKLKGSKIKKNFSETYNGHDDIKEKSSILNNEKVSSEETLAFKLDAKLNLINDSAVSVSEEGEITDNSHGNLQITDDMENRTRWNSSNIVEEVQSLAEKNVINSGYIFVEEYGMYYDSTSGYYYDPSTTLFYDGITGTYFYYDHESQCYQFHSQLCGQQSTSKGDLSTIQKTTKNCEENSQHVASKVEDLEEGECSSSSCEFLEDTNGYKSPNASCLSVNEGKESCEYNQNDIAPSLRLMVTSEELKGQLHVVTLVGGTIGREETNAVFLQDPSVSKLHASIVYKSEGPNDHHYYIKDIGSNNGTLVRGQRLSESRKESHLVELGHRWDIQCGTIGLTCHIHPGYLTCNACEPGLIIDYTKLKNSTANSSTQMAKDSKEKERRRQNKCLRKKFALEFHTKDNEHPPSNLVYQDRTALRIDAVGSENPYQKTEVASIDTNISKGNKGFQLLEKMGWSEGQGLGLKQNGIMQPVVPIVPFNRTGLGGYPSVLYAGNDTSERKIANTSSKLSSVTISAIDFTPAVKDKT